MEIIVRFCLTYYFKLYYDIKVRHNIVEGPVHILTQIRILQKQPKIVRDIITPYIRTGAWYSHSECVLLHLVTSDRKEQREFGVKQILAVRGKNEFGDMSVRPRVTPKLICQPKLWRV